VWDTIPITANAAIAAASPTARRCGAKGGGSDAGMGAT
jgi:hypothetical protein